MTIGKLKEILRTAKPEQCVFFDFCNCRPTTIDSWRGIYAHPALGWTPTGYSANEIDASKRTTVKALLNELEKGTSDCYSGWKGDDYCYHDESLLHIDNSGDNTGTEIDYVTVGDLYVTIHTKRLDPL